MVNILIGGIPFIVVLYLIYFRKQHSSNNILIVLIFLSYMVFATNYENYGLNFDLYRYIHKSIGVLVSLSLIYFCFKNGFDVIKNKISIFIALYLGVICLSYFGNDLYLPHYILYVKNFVFISFIMLFINYKIENQENLNELFKFIIHMTLILSSFVILELILIGGFTRIFLFYPNPNYLAVSLMFGFSILLFSELKFKFLKIVLVISAILLTGSRAIELGVVILLLLFLFKNREKIKIKYILYVFIFFAVIFGFFLEKIPGVKESSKQYNKSNIINIINTDKGRGNIRHALGKITFHMLGENPINGIGYGQFRTKYSHYVDEEIINMNISELNIKVAKSEELMSHNDLFQIISELGLLGLFFILFYLYHLYYMLKQLIISNKDYFYISISLLVGSLTFSMFHNNITSFVFWFILFVPFIMNKLCENKAYR